LLTATRPAAVVGVRELELLRGFHVNDDPAHPGTVGLPAGPDIYVAYWPI
jgi:hypothetical protein